MFACACRSHKRTMPVYAECNTHVHTRESTWLCLQSLSRTRSPSSAEHMLSHGGTHTQVPMQSGAVKLQGVVMQPFTGQMQFGSQHMAPSG